jgi:hypothetical protein
LAELFWRITNDSVTSGLFYCIIYCITVFTVLSTLLLYYLLHYTIIYCIIVLSNYYCIIYYITVISTLQNQLNLFRTNFRINYWIVSVRNRGGNGDILVNRKTVCAENYVKIARTCSKQTLISDYYLQPSLWFLFCK